MCCFVEDGSSGLDCVNVFSISNLGPGPATLDRATGGAASNLGPGQRPASYNLQPGVAASNLGPAYEVGPERVKAILGPATGDAASNLGPGASCHKQN